MKNYYWGLGFVVLLSAPWTQSRADAVVSPIISNPVVVSGPISSTGTVASTATSIAVSCIDDSGNATGGSGGCAAILPKCSDLKTANETAVKNFLSWKIWGYYQGKNVDLDNSTLTAANPTLTGPTLAYPICSIVGHQMQMTSPPNGSTAGSCDKTRAGPIAAYQAAGIEYATQTIGNKGSCGARPTVSATDLTMTLVFTNGSGNQWNSWLIGAYPWLIRRYAYEVLNQIKPDMSNLADVISDPTVKADMATMNGKMTAFYTNLSTQSQAVCAARSSDIVTKCNNGSMSLNDPANRLCTLVKAQAALNTGSLPNIIVKEIMSRVETNYEALFENLMTFQAGQAKALWSQCQNVGGLFKTGGKKKAQTSSCIFDGGNYYAYSSDNTPTLENDCNGGSHQGTYSVRPGFGIMYGFAGLVETIIRHDICQQNSISDTSVCDTVNIPDKPAGVQ